MWIRTSAPVEAVTDLVGQGVGRPVCGLERRPVGELEVDVDS